ncbi:hypothetical protein NQD34_000849 [Periophthalmus magnuspinnatus]|nr:hypothetical protein NQD34_000849 [Periophthalmus magnuspinnatus]
MKVFSVIALFLAVAAAQSGDDDTMESESPEDEGWPEHPAVKPTGRPWLPYKPGDSRLKHSGPGGRSPGLHFYKKPIVFSPIFKIDNVTFQNSSDVQLKEGENIFFLMKETRPPFKQYVKLTYNSTEPNQVTVEFGELQPPARVFLPVFKVENVTFQNITSVQLMQGENLFLKVKGRGPHPPHHFKPRHFKLPFRPPHGPPFKGQYVKVTYNSTEPGQVSVEYGIVRSTFSIRSLSEEEDDCTVQYEKEE